MTSLNVLTNYHYLNPIIYPSIQATPPLPIGVFTHTNSQTKRPKRRKRKKRMIGRDTYWPDKNCACACVGATWSPSVSTAAAPGGHGDEKPQACTRESSRPTDRRAGGLTVPVRTRNECRCVPAINCMRGSSPVFTLILLNLALLASGMDVLGWGWRCLFARTFFNTRLSTRWSTFP